MNEWFRKKKVTAIIITAVCGAVVCLIIASALWSFFEPLSAEDYNFCIEENWGISLPSECGYKEVYGKDTGASFLGDGERYHVFSYEYEHEFSVSVMLVWRDEEAQTIRSETYSQAADAVLYKLDVPSDKYPDYSRCKYWYQSQSDGSEIILFWNKDEQKIYTVESFI